MPLRLLSSKNKTKTMKIIPELFIGWITQHGLLDNTRTREIDIFQGIPTKSLFPPMESPQTLLGPNRNPSELEATLQP
jgi:hypothetical protein